MLYEPATLAMHNVYMTLGLKSVLLQKTLGTLCYVGEIEIHNFTFLCPDGLPGVSYHGATNHQEVALFIILVLIAWSLISVSMVVLAVIVYVKMTHHRVSFAFLTRRFIYVLICIVGILLINHSSLWLEGQPWAKTLLSG